MLFAVFATVMMEIRPPLSRDPKLNLSIRPSYPAPILPTSDA